MHEGFPPGGCEEPAAARYTSPAALMPTAALDLTVTPVSVHSWLLGTLRPGVDMQPGPAHADVPELLNACTEKHWKAPGVVVTSVAVTGPVRLFSAPPLHPSVPQPLLTLNPVTSADLSDQETRMVYWLKAVATT